MAEASGAAGGGVVAGHRGSLRLSPQTFSAFSSPTFRLLWANNFSYGLVHGIQRFAFVWLALEISQSNGVLGLVSFALGIPVLFFSLPVGVLSDRVDRRLILMGSQLLVLFTSLGGALLIWGGLMTVPVAIGLAFVVGTGVAVGQPVRQAIVPSIVAPERLMNAITLNSMGQNVSQIVGPAVGGAAIALWGIGGNFAVQAGLMGVGLLVLIPLRVPPPEGAGGPRRRMRAEIGEGFAFVLHAPEVRALFALLVATSLIIIGPWQALLPKIAKEQLGSDALRASLLFAAMGAGMIGSSLVLASIKGLKNAGGWFTCSLVLSGILAVGMGLSHSYALTLSLMLLSGMAGGFFVNLNLTLVQSHTPRPVMGRVMSIYTLGMMGGSPLGALLAGGGAELVGAGEWFAICGAAIALLGVLFLITQPRVRRMPSESEAA